MSALFQPGGRKVFTIPPGANFLDELAAVLAEELGLKRDPEALADALIYVPNRRSERALAFALNKAGGRGACLLPDIRALGDLETDEPPPSAEAALADLPLVMSNGVRIGSLTRLVMAYFDAQGVNMPATACLSAARELARLLDQSALSGEVDWAALAQHELGAHLAQHWQQSLEFLSIITDQWPAQLEEATAVDPYARRYEAAKAMVAEWQARPPQSPVIIAGSTGATPASQLLMRAALALPNGLVVLPGLDRDLTLEAIAHIESAPSHPQFTLVRTLSKLDLTPQEVVPWPGSSSDPAQDARRRLIHEALAPAPVTADWTERLTALSPDGDNAAFVSTALDGLSHVQATDDAEEALLAALLLREALEHKDRTAALVTPDAGLARAVSVMLRRWNIEIAPSAGLPLPQTGSGSFALLVADWLLDPAHPVALMAVLNHPSCRFDRETIAALDRHVLRGVRVWESWPDLIAHVGQLSMSPKDRRATYTPDEMTAIHSLLEQLDRALATAKIGPTPQTPGETWYQSIAQACTEIAVAPQPWSGEDGAALSSLFRHLAELAEPLGPQPATVWNDLLASEARQVSVRSGATHPRLAIWGPLEARLQSADQLILAGLNEDIWPAQPAADAFLPRAFREKVGLSDPDERIGLSAHDFAQLAAAPNVTLLSSQRRDDKPAVASRWLWRLQTLTRGALKQDANSALSPPPERDPRIWLKALEAAPSLASDFSAEPRPRPPVSARPGGLSVTRIEQLVRDPYAIYCEYVLGLGRLDPLNLAADVRIRGTAIHKALERFELGDAEHTAEALLDLLEAELRNGGEPEADIIALRDRRREVCAEFLTWRESQQALMQGDPLTEIYGEIELQISGHPFRLYATADRIEAHTSGGAAILDFKSGKPPTEPQVRTGLSPQMPLQGLIAREGGFEALGKRQVDALTYIRFGTQFDVREIGDAGSRLDAKPVSEIIAEAEAGLKRLITAFVDPDHPYLSAPRPERVSYESDYSRLARRDEWTGLSTYD